MRSAVFRPILLLHLAAAGLALTYAVLISQTDYVATGLQFVAPLIVIMGVHGFWLIGSRSLQPGFSYLIYRRSAQTAIGLAVGIFAASILAPPPAHAGGSDFLGVAFSVVFCVAIIAIVVGIVALVIWLVFKLVRAIFASRGSDGSQGPDNRLFDIGSISATVFFLCVGSAEGLPFTYAFPNAHDSTASYHVDADPAQVWQTLEQATSPEFPLPQVLHVFPRPVDVSVDEGTRPGGIRKVVFEGREGDGVLTLKVTERSETRVVYSVLEDTSPIAGWVAHRAIIYSVAPEQGGTRLSVTLEFDRLLAPAWFFSPLTQSAAYYAMDVLARDVKARSER